MHFGGPQTRSEFNEAVFCIRSTRNAYFSLFRYLRKTTSWDLTNVFLTEGLHEMDVSGKCPRLAFIILQGTQHLPNCSGRAIRSLSSNIVPGPQLQTGAVGQV